MKVLQTPTTGKGEHTVKDKTPLHFHTALPIINDISSFCKFRLLCGLYFRIFSACEGSHIHDSRFCVAGANRNRRACKIHSARLRVGYRHLHARFFFVGAFEKGCGRDYLRNPCPPHQKRKVEGMEYKEMYLELFRVVTKSIGILQEAQLTTEEIYLLNDDPEPPHEED